MSLLRLSILTPETRLMKDHPVKEVLVPSVRGFLGILPGHAPMLSMLSAGILKYLPEESEQWENLAVGWGYLEVCQNQVKILAESLEVKQDLDRARIQKELKSLLQKLKSLDLEPSERKELEKQKQWLESRLALGVSPSSSKGKGAF